ncbi:fumarylacetoacetate hydrolase family protein [Plenodomus tracheiphilus IPT5]|uniref:Fumarylacetoacetate hydrolase family protein n=1 Tax=Plenodomus tracheiphilus IPT5 TaxID=1408161 RepID=A0A6A7ARB5_9PLEO|nr:fumarylacetoacetate hydrolase family protein [Plenodomus tracheiphilus IPT5]
MEIAATFTKLVRYKQGSQIYHGDLLDSSAGRYRVARLEKTPTGAFKQVGQEDVVEKLLCPLEWTPIFQCVGLNYRKHATEANLTVPKYPVIFTKPGDALAGPFDAIQIHSDAQEKLDYEGELCVIIGQDAKNVPEADALNYVLGYSIGNDVSARHYQLPDVSGGQFCYAKSFDQFAPLGPAIWSSSVVKDPQALSYKTKVNGEVVQETSTNDMIWSVQQIVQHLSRGTTLRKGTVIMTGTPSGVGFFRNKFLGHGDIVEVELDGLGSIANSMQFE